MNVLYCSHTADLKGSAISLYQLMSKLDKSRFRPVAAFSKDGPLVKRVAADGIPAHVLKDRGVLGVGLIREALKLVKEEKVELVHLNCAVPFCKYVGIAAKIKGIPVVWHVREDPQGKRVRRLKGWIRLLADRILVVSSDQMEVFAYTRKAVKIYNGVDVEKFRPGIDGETFRKRSGIPSDAFVFGMVGTIEERKGNLSFLKAAEKLSGEHGRAWFVMVGGPGDQGYLERMRLFIEQRPALSARTVLTGNLTDMPEVMAGLDVLVMPSLWEGFSRALIEAMASGKPVIASTVGETPHVLEDGRSGFLVPPGEQSPLEDSMTRCMGMGEALAVMGARARERALEFTLERHVANVQDVYNSFF